MVETITPAGCGSRHRYRVALALFSVGAIGAAAALGALLGLAGASLDRSWTVPVLAVLALVAGLREWGVLRVPLPGAHRQVPERWRREWPLGAWSLAYGAGLGAGIFTHQVVASFWVACAGAIAIGDPAWSAACLALFGAGRALMVALPARGGRDPSVAVGRLARRARLCGRRTRSCWWRSPRCWRPRRPSLRRRRRRVASTLPWPERCWPSRSSTRRAPPSSSARRDGRTSASPAAGRRRSTSICWPTRTPRASTSSGGPPASRSGACRAMSTRPPSTGRGSPTCAAPGRASASRCSTW